MSNFDPSVRGVPYMPSTLFMEHQPVHALPSWLLPVAFRALHGGAGMASINGIGVNEDGDLVLYRKIQHEDTMAHMGLIGIDEVWIVIELPQD